MDDEEADNDSVVSGLNATDKTPMYEMPLIYVFGVWGFGVWVSIFCIGVLGNGIVIGILSRDLAEIHLRLSFALSASASCH